MKFRHRFKKIVQDANNKSHFLPCGTQLQENTETPFKPSVKIVTPYNNGYYNLDLTARKFISNRVMGYGNNGSERNMSNSHSRNRSVDPMRPSENLNRLNLSYDASMNRNRVQLPRLGLHSRNLSRIGSRIMGEPISLTNVYK
jgi:hypothetical protein